MTKPLFPLEPLAALMGESLASLGRILSVSGSTWKQYRDEGVSEKVADRLAARAGFHPAEIWSEWWTLSEVDCAYELCPDRFIAVNPRQRYCTKNCAKKASARRRYHSDPAHRETVRVKNREYQSEAREAVLATKRAYHRRTYQPEQRRAVYEAQRDRWLDYQADYRARTAA